MIRIRPPDFVRICSALVIGAALLTLLGRLFAVEPVAALGPAYLPLNPAAALGFLLAGVALAGATEPQILAQGRPLMFACGGAVAMLGGLRLAGLAFDWQPPWFAGERPMAVSTATGFLLIGAALLVIDGPFPSPVRWADYLAVATAVLSFAPLVGYGYGGSASAQFAALAMALDSAVLLQALSLGVLYARPHQGLMSVILSRNLGGIVARRLLPAAILIPCLLGWMRLLGQRAQLYDTELGATLLVTATIVLFCGAALWTASLLNRVDEERQRADESLRQSSEQIYDLYTRAPCGHHSLDEHGVFLAINETELDWLGCSREELIGQRSFSDFVAPAFRPMMDESFEQFKQQGSINGLEFSMLRRDGTELPVMLHATAIYDADGAYLASRSTLFDATQLRRAQQTARELNAQLERRVKERTAELARSNADLVQKNQENEMFVYGISHDLRSPLVNLEGFSGELSAVCGELRERLHADDRTPEAHRRNLELLDVDMKQSIQFIQTAVARLSTIIDALLRLSRAGRIEYQWQRVEMAEVVDRVVESMSVSIYDAAASVAVGELPPVYGDPTAVEQVTANLISNAVNYLDPTRPGAIEIGALIGQDANDVDVDLEGPPLLTFYVRDNGQGIPAAYQSKVFQALKRLHPQAAEGEGVGLALVRRIIQRHGGEIWFASEEGEGTTFYFTLPSYMHSHMVDGHNQEEKERSDSSDCGTFGDPVGGGR